MQLHLSPKIGPYGVAVGLVVLASLLRLVLGPLWREDVPALLFYPVVVLSAWYGGLGPGLDLNDLLGLGIFFTIGFLISVLNERQLRHATAALATLRKSEQRYRLLFQLNPAGMFQSRQDGQIVDCNDAFVRLLGFSSREEVLSRNAREFYANPQDRDELTARVRPGRVMTNQEVQWWRSDGRPLAILLSVRKDEDGLLEGIAMDIPDRRPTWRSG